MDEVNISKETVNEIGLRSTDGCIEAPIVRNARVFRYRHLEKVFIRANDIYRTPMPENSCYLAFYGHQATMGKHTIQVNKLQHLYAYR